MQVLEFMDWLAATGPSTALRESILVYPVVESLHVLSLLFFAGAVWMLDLRLLGIAFPKMSAPTMAARLLPWTVSSFAFVSVTGLLLFYANPQRTFHSIWFRAKVLLLVAAMLNAVIFHWRAKGGRLPSAARLSGGVSLLVWIMVIVFGRLTAYNWFDCGKEMPQWIYQFTQCPPAVPE
jgi:hypothetical protein